MGYYIGMSYLKFFSLILIITIVFDAFQSITGKKKLCYVISVFAIFFVVMGFRHYAMGSDTASYYVMFWSVSTTSDIVKYAEVSDIESGYLYYNWILSCISDNPRILFVVTAAIVNFALGFFVYRNVSNPGIFCCIFVTLLQFDFFLSAMRQAMAVAVLLFAVDALIRKNRMRFVLLSLFATVFHNAAWIMLLFSPFLWNNNSEKDEKSIWFYVTIAVICIFCLFFFDKVWEILLNIFPKYDYYNDSEMADGEPRLAIYLKILVYALLFLVPKLYKKDKEENRGLYNVGEKLSLLQVVMYVVAVNATALARLAGCFSVFALGHFSNSFKRNTSNEKLRFWLIVLMCTFVYGLIILIYRTPEWQTTYPIMLQIEKFW